MANFCRKCGSKLEESDVFCQNCGEKIKNSPIPQPASQVEQPIHSVPQQSVQTAVTTEQSPVQSPPTEPTAEQAQKNPLHSATSTEKAQNTPKKPHDPSAKHRPIVFRITACALVFVMSITAAVKLISNSKVTIAPYDATGVFVCGAVYSENDIEKAKTKTAKVSPEKCEVKAGDLTVNFSEWNLDGEDELVVKKLPTLKDKASGCTVKGYDISLKSGLDSFCTDVAITIPRSGENGEIYYYNEAEKKWEYVYSEISEDGKSYIAYTDHFSSYAEIRSDGKAVNMSGKSSTSGALFREYQLYDNVMLNPVVLDEEALLNAYNRDVMGTITKIEQTKSVKKTLAESDPAEITGHIGNAAGGADISFDMLPEHLSEPLGAHFKTIDTVCTIIKITEECNSGEMLSDALWNNALDVLGSGLGIAELVAASAAPEIAAGCAVVGVVIYAIDVYNDYAPEELPIPERAYHEYANHTSVQTLSTTYMQNISPYNNTLILTTSGNRAWAIVIGGIFNEFSDDPVKLNETIDELYEVYADRYWTEYSLNERAGYDKDYRERNNLPKNNLYTDPDAEAIEQMKQRLIQEVKYNTKGILKANADKQRRKAIEALRRMITEETVPLLNTKIIISITDPNVKDGKYFDSSDYAGKDFRDYSSGNTTDFPMMFTDSSTALFTPVGKTISDYPYELFVPKAQKDSNVVFECTLYHYMMMDCPTKLRLNAVKDLLGKEKLPPVILNFTLPKPSSDGVIYVDLSLGFEDKETVNISSFAYEPYPEQDTSDYDNAFNISLLMEYSIINNGDIPVIHNSDGSYTMTIPAWSKTYSHGYEGNNNTATEIYSMPSVTLTGHAMEDKVGLIFNGVINQNIEMTHTGTIEGLSGEYTDVSTFSDIKIEVELYQDTYHDEESRWFMHIDSDYYLTKVSYSPSEEPWERYSGETGDYSDSLITVKE